MTSDVFAYHDLFPLESDDTPYRLLSREGVSVASFEGEEIVKVERAC